MKAPYYNTVRTPTAEDCLRHKFAELFSELLEENSPDYRESVGMISELFSWHAIEVLVIVDIGCLWLPLVGKGGRVLLCCILLLLVVLCADC